MKDKVNPVRPGFTRCSVTVMRPPGFSCIPPDLKSISVRAFMFVNGKFVSTKLLMEKYSAREAIALGFLRVSERWRGAKNDEVPVVLTAQGRKELARLAALEEKRRLGARWR